MKWFSFDDGASVGKIGCEQSVILRDEENSSGAHVTLERDGRIAPFSITCGIYGWMFHTRFLDSLTQAETEYAQMKEDISHILEIIALEADSQVREKMEKISDEISKFVERYS